MGDVVDIKESPIFGTFDVVASDPENVVEQQTGGSDLPRRLSQVGRRMAGRMHSPPLMSATGCLGRVVPCKAPL